ncbi:MAG: DnaD domain protein [Pigeon pea little leaf phytoplasma]|uniref:DnaD domain protein n=1 Tax=Candidatus Phytoplasma fabacearum TaxID=2982628 RepID=A0ABU8ZSX0_9MOLU|nr:DnaD domain protein ['Bituminaria bituminosa' little leaf phytoplasma]MDV3148601.1 DnaD domain protein [Pigeon pea little leaf phytoplasma]MDO7983573.1 DnaD domain protein ['Bituminaria bituminosa' little leaf phytoplasma]MDO8023727.1 DnaD domain protein ['Bituminaria bituminosa' little leaf phytoplasma]MDO8030543.1 DnaD domain protein ['Bituminaria bituminosa' little leaf phytoplasma]MDV3154137.1 DnaD domain protein [Pigeon pea little leaf phytoplasma]
MLKQIYEEGYLDIERILINQYLKLNLLIKEVKMLLLLFRKYKNPILSTEKIIQQTNLSLPEIDNILGNLIKKNFLCLYQKEINNQVQEMFDLNKTFYQIENLYKQTKLTNLKHQNTSNISNTISNIEKIKGDVLNSQELEIIKKWYIEFNYPQDTIIKAIKQAHVNKKKSIFYINSLLNYQNKQNNISQDKNIEKTLHKIFDKIK